MMKSKSIRNSILINNFITLAIPLIFFGSFTIQIFINNYEADIIKQNTIIASTLSEQFETALQEPIRIIDLIRHSYLLSLDTDKSVLNSSINSIQITYPYILNIEILNKAGSVIHSAVNQDDIGINRTGEAFYENLLDSDTTYYWSSPYISTAMGQLTYSLTYKTPESQYIIVYISLQSLTESARKYKGQFGEDVHIEIVDTYGRYISHENIEKVYYRMLDKHIDKIKSIASGSLTHSTVVVNDVSYVITASSLDSLHWYVAIYQPTSSVFGILWYLIVIMIGLLIFSTLASIIYTFIYSGKINLFISEFKSSMDEALQEGYRVQLPDFRFDDLNEVGQQFSILMSEINKRDTKLVEMAYTDQLTKLGNRLLMTETIEILVTQKDITSITYVLINIDEFKMINDIYNHETGDQLLLFISNELLALSKGTQCHLFRVGPDEFCLIFKEKVLIEELNDMLSKLKAKMSEGVYLNRMLVRGSFTTGASYYPEHSKDAKKLTQYADIALIEAKTNKRGGINLFNISMNETLSSRSSMDNFIRTALENNMFELHYQPIIQIETGNIVGFEALLRLRKSSGDLILPNSFIRIAEASGLIFEIGEWVIMEAIRKIKILNTTFSKPYKIVINISTVQMSSPHFATKVLQLLHNTDTNLSLLEFDITESVFTHAEKQALETMKYLSQEGIHFSLDDFGSGYSSLSYLTSMPFQTLKIDRSFLVDVASNEQKKNMLDSIINMGHKLNYTIIAEGIETLDQLETCKKYNCDLAQGYLYSRPLPFEQLILYLKR